MPPHRRFRAPAANGEVLAEPGIAAVPALVDENRRRLDRSDVVVGGLPLKDLRALARREVLEAAREYTSTSSGQSPPVATGGPDSPLLIAGHQPELSHPGVWVKHFALNGLARRLGGTPLNLVVDNDTLKSTSLRFPVWHDRDPASVHLQAIRFDQFSGEQPYAEREVADAACFRSFPERAAPAWANWGYEPLLPSAWKAAAEPPSRTTLVGERFVAARRRLEREWGCHNHEFTVTSLFWVEAYTRFVAHILLDAERFAAAYNAAVRRYRVANGVHSKNHPAPDLDRRGDAVEVPFWSWGYGIPDRQRVFVRTDGDRLQLDMGAQAWFTADVERFVREWPGLSESGTRFTPRALTLTLFARVCLGDFFIHGIGGGKYDEVTDDIIRHYFGVEPPAYQVLSATLHLPLPGFPATAADVRRRQRHVRDLDWNPQRHLPAAVAARPDVAALVAEKERLTAAEPPPGDRPARRHWFRELSAVTERLRPFAADQRRDAERAFVTADLEAGANAVLRRRDYSWVLYPEHTLRPFLQRFLDV